MVNSKNSLNLKPNKNTSQKNVYSRLQVDGIVKREKAQDISAKNLENKSLPPNSNEISKFVETKIEKIPEVKAEIITESKMKNDETKSFIDDNKRLFFKVAGVAGLGLAASALFPKSSEAYVSGSTPTSNVVGLKDSSNTRIDPAQEDGNLATIAGKDFATQTTLAGIKTSTDKFTFDSGNLKVTSSGGSDVVGLKDTSNVRINPAQDDSITLLRRMVKMMESQAVVDNQMRQRVAVDIMPTTTVTGTVTVGSITTLTSLNQLAGVDSRWQIIDWSRQVYNSGMRNNLSW